MEIFQTTVYQGNKNKEVLDHSAQLPLDVRRGVSKEVEDGRRLPALWAGHP
jgi:hypothetical protein